MVLIDESSEKKSILIFFRVIPPVAKKSYHIQCVPRSVSVDHCSVYTDKLPQN